MKYTLCPETCVELMDVASLSLSFLPSFSLFPFFFLICNFVHLFLAMLGLHCCAGFSAVAVSQGFAAVLLLLLGWLLGSRAR